MKNQRFYSFITITGLAIGIASGFLILQYVFFETSYDQFLENKENIYRVQLDRYNDGQLSTQWAAGCAGVGLAMKEDFPEVLDFVNLKKSNALIGHEKDYFETDYAYYAGANFFEIFSVALLSGVDSLVLADPFTVVLSKSLADKIFGDQEPVGQLIKMNDDDDFLVTGVFEDLPERSHMKFDLLYSFETYVGFTSENARTAWQWDGFLNYVLLREGVDPAALAVKFPEFIERRAGQELADYNSGMIYNLQRLDKIHLISDFRGEIKPTGDQQATYFLLVIGLFVLIIAWINYINLTTAHSLRRAREVGVRKVLGSLKSQLVRQFLLESTVMNMLAFALAIGIVLIVFPFFSEFLGRQTAYTWPDTPLFWGGLASFFVVGIIFSSIYPAMVLSGFDAVKVLKGSFSSTGHGKYLRQGLVTLQFVVSIFLITGSYIVFKQLKFLQSQDLGVSIDQTLVIKTPNYSTDSILSSRDDIFRNQLAAEHAVSSITTSSAVPGRTPDWNAGGIRLLHQTEHESNQYRIVGCDDKFLDLYNLNVVAGRGFDQKYQLEDEHVLFNESAAKRMGFQNPEELLNRKINFWGDTFSVVGIVKDYRQESPKQAYDALIFRYFANPSGYYSLSMNTSNMQSSLASVQVHWKRAFQNKPFDYFFLDDYYNEQYKSELRFGSIFALFASLAIIVACLGLFGLASYVTNLRSKEVSMRKILGASVQNLWLLLTTHFLKWILVAVALGIPIIWLVFSSWLNNFANRITLSWYMFLIPTIVLVAIATLTVSYFTLRAVFQNPSSNLKYE